MKCLDALFMLAAMAICKPLLAQSADPNCHVEVISGSPASFVFSSMKDYEEGKVMMYSSTVRAYYTKEPEQWQLCVRSDSPLFDGPGSLSVEIIGIKVERLLFNRAEIPQAGENHSWAPAGSVQLGQSETVLAYGQTSRSFSFGDNQVLDFEIRFTCRSTASATIGNEPQGYYASQAFFFMNTKYK